MEGGGNRINVPFILLPYDTRALELDVGDCKIDARTHWSTPNFRVEQRAVRKGDVLDLRMKLDDIRSMDSWSIEVAG